MIQHIKKPRIYIKTIKLINDLKARFQILDIFYLFLKMLMNTIEMKIIE